MLMQRMEQRILKHCQVDLDFYGIEKTMDFLLAEIRYQYWEDWGEKKLQCIWYALDKYNNFLKNKIKKFKKFTYR